MKSYASAIVHKPDYAVAYFNRGVLFKDLGQFPSALSDYARAISINGKFVQAHYNRAVLLHSIRDWHAALASYDAAITLKKDHVDAWGNRGIVLRELGELDDALASYNRAIELDPANSRAYCNRGVTQLARNELSDALDSYERAIRIDPNYAQAFLNRGILFAKLQKWGDARSNYDRAIQLEPGMADAYSGRGQLLDAVGRAPEALSDYDRALSIRPDFAQARFNKSLALLSLGHFVEGWRGHEWRWQSEMTSSAKERRTLEQPLWLGEDDIRDAAILLYAEQGLGDTLQFCRYASLVADRGARVVLEVQRPLIGLMALLPGIAQVVARGDPVPRVDYQCPLMSLPLAFKTTMDTIPANPRYLAASASRISALRSKLGEKTKPRIGLAWSGSATHPNDRNRSLALSELLRYLPDGFQYFCLQKDIRPADERLLHSALGVCVLTDELNNFDDTAALCECMDLVISVDTSLAHLSAALGTKTWVLIGAIADWRWFRERRDSPWYPTAVLFRQTSFGDWTEVLEDVRRALTRHLAQASS